MRRAATRLAVTFIAAVALLAIGSVLWVKREPSRSGTEDDVLNAMPGPKAVVLSDFAENAPDGSLRLRPDWARQLYAEADDPGVYRPGESSDTRPFDNSDPEMRKLMADIYAVGGCGRPGVLCEPVMERFQAGGDRLASYLIRQLVESERGGWPNNDTFVEYIAYTRSETGFEFIRERIANRDSLSPPDALRAIDALGYTAHPRGIDVALQILRDPDTPNYYYDHLANVLYRIPLDTGRLGPEELGALRKLSAEGWVNAKGAILALENHFDLESLKPRTPQ